MDILYSLKSGHYVKQPANKHFYFCKKSLSIVLVYLSVEMERQVKYVTVFLMRYFENF